MPRFNKARDISFFNSIARELVDAVVETSLVLFKLSPTESKINLYGESLDKWYFSGVQVNGLISREATSTNYEEFGADTTQTVEFRFNRFSLKEKDLYAEIGDIIFHNESYFEISNIRDDQYIGGQTGKFDPNERFSIICETFMVRKSSLNIIERI